MDTETSTPAPDVNFDALPDAPGLWSDDAGGDAGDTAASDAAPGAAGAPEAQAAPDAAAAPEKPAEQDAAPAEPQVPASLQKMLDDIASRDAALKQRESKMREADKLAGIAERHQQLVERLQKDPLAAIQDVGGDAATALRRAFGLEQQEPDDPRYRALQDRFERLEKTLTSDREQREQAAVTERTQRAQQVMLDNYKKLSSEQAERYPHLAMHAIDLGPATMFAQAQQYAQQSGSWLPDEQAAARAEALIKEQTSALLERLRQSPVYRDLFVQQAAAQDGASPGASQATTSSPPRGTTVLRGKHTAEPPQVTIDKQVDPNDDAALLAAAAKRFETMGGWQKK